MKRINEIALLSLPFVAVPAFLLMGNLLANSKIAAKQEGFNKVVKTEYFEDTLANYRLYSDSLIIEFQKTLKIPDWFGEIFVVKKDRWEVGAEIQMPGQKDGQLGEMHFTNGKATFRGFHLQKDSLSSYRVLCRMVPHYPGRVGIGDVYLPQYLFSSSETISNKLVLSDQVKDLKIVVYDLTELNNLERDVQLFCIDSIEKIMDHFYDLDK